MNPTQALRNLGLRIRLSRAYEELKILERNATNPSLREKNKQELAAIQTWVSAMKVTSLESKELFDLKGHIDMVPERLKLDS